MKNDFKYTKADLEEMRMWPLDRKIQVTQTRWLEWYSMFDGRIYIAGAEGEEAAHGAEVDA